jgi:hypothetical protein
VVFAMATLASCSKSEPAPEAKADPATSVAPSASAPPVDSALIGIGGIGSIGVGHGPAMVAAYGAPAPPLPPDPAKISLSGVTAPGITDATAVLYAAKGRFLNCYRMGRKADPAQSGSVELAITVGPGGKVTAAKATPAGTIRPDVALCIERVTKGLEFSAPATPPVKIAAKVSLTPS